MQIMDTVRTRNPGEKEYQQAVSEVLESVEPILDQHPEYRQTALLERLVEPERTVSFRVPWTDDQGQVQVNRGFQIEMSSAIGPFKGGLRFHPSVTQSILKFLAFEQVFKNALTSMPMGGAAGGSDFDPKGKSDDEVMRFCQSYMTELYRHIGAKTDIPSGDIGVGSREIGYLYGMYKKLSNQFNGALTGKHQNWGGSLMRQEAAGYGCVYFAAEMLSQRSDTLDGKSCLVSGSGKVATYVAEKLDQLGAKVLTLSDSGGYIHDPEGIDRQKLDFVKLLKHVRRGRIAEYTEKYPNAKYHPYDIQLEFNPLWRHRADCAFPCAFENEISKTDAYNLINNHIKLVCEGANMPCTADAVDIFQSKRILYAPGKAANAGGAASAGLELAQNSMRLAWTRQEVDDRLKIIMQTIHRTCLDVAEKYNSPGNYTAGANIAGFIKVTDAMLDQGVI